MKNLILGLLAVLGIALGAASLAAPAQAQLFGPQHSYYGSPTNPLGGD